MKLVRENADMALVACGTLCDRCGATELDQSAATARPAVPTFVTKTLEGPADELFRGHFCPDCNVLQGGNAGNWHPHLRMVSRLTIGGNCTKYRFPVQLAATGERFWIETLLSDDDLM